MADTVDGLLRKVASFGPRLERNTLAALGQAAYFTKLTMVATAESQGWPARPSWVKYEIEIRGGRPVAVLMLRGGRAHMFERGARPHVVGDGSRRRGAKVTISKAQARRNAAGPRVLAGPDFGPVTGPVHHPGFKAPGYFYKGAAAALPGVSKILGVGILTRSLAQTFGGGLAA